MDDTYITMFSAGLCDLRNNRYPNEHSVNNAGQLAEAIKTDHVFAKYENDIRGNAHFVKADCIAMDADNDHTEDPAMWLTPDNNSFNDVTFYYYPSTHNNIGKNGFSPRGRGHYIFPLSKPIFSADECADLKKDIYDAEPRFDKNALDAARVFRGVDVSPDDIVIHAGAKFIDEVLAEHSDRLLDVDVENTDDRMDAPEFDVDMLSDGAEKCEEISDLTNISVVSKSTRCGKRKIPVGERNTTLHEDAVKYLVRFGNNAHSQELFRKDSKRCEEPLPEAELWSIWNSAVKFYSSNVVNDDKYIPPDEYEKKKKRRVGAYKPDDFTDSGQAKKMAEYYGDTIAFTEERGFLTFDGVRWRHGNAFAFGRLDEFLEDQRKDADAYMEKFKEEAINAGVSKEAIERGGKKLEDVLLAKSHDLYRRYRDALDYQKFAKSRRDYKYISWTMNKLQPIVQKALDEFDANPYLLNCPSGTFDLRTGKRKSHDPKDYITQITSVDPGEEGKDIWDAHIDLITCGDKKYADYLKHLYGEMSFGKVFNEQFIMEPGEGGNGKSSFNNAYFKVLGSYAKKIPIRALVKGNKNFNYDLFFAGLRAKRFLLASDVKKEDQLDDQIVRTIAATDVITGRHLYKEDIEFPPSHSIVMFTNPLPQLLTNERSVIRRIKVLPFEARIRYDKDIKNYGDVLFEMAGPAIMQWILDGARGAYEEDFKYKVPYIVEKATREYVIELGWLSKFIRECCLIDPKFEQPSGQFYRFYRSYTGDPVSTKIFYEALKNAKIKDKRTRKGSFILGLKIKPELLKDFEESEKTG